MEMAKKRAGMTFLRKALYILVKCQKAAIAGIRQSGGETVTTLHCMGNKMLHLFLMSRPSVRTSHSQSV